VTVGLRWRNVDGPAGESISSERSMKTWLTDAMSPVLNDLRSIEAEERLDVTPSV